MPTVLIIDDEPNIRRMVGALLGAEGYDVRDASDGASGARRATKLGAFTFLEKPLTPEGVLLALSSAMELRRARLEARTLRADLGLDGEMVGESPGIQKVRDLVNRVAPTDSRVLITGESGVGKELVASAIHNGSARRDRSFVRVNCAAI